MFNNDPDYVTRRFQRIFGRGHRLRKKLGSASDRPRVASA